MKLLFVHERFGALAGAEANILATARELRQRGHTVGVLHGPGTGKGEQLWRETFTHAFPLPPTDKAIGVLDVIDQFQPDLAYIHKMADLEVLGALFDSDTPLVRNVH